MRYKATVEAELVAGLKQREQAAFSCFYDAYSAKMYGVLLRIVRDEEIAQDLLQDSFVKAWANMGGYDAGKGRLFTWLLNIARNTALDYLRKRKSRPLGNNLIQMHDPESIRQIDLCHSVAALAGDTIGIWEQVERLDAKYSVLIELAFGQGCTYQEAAQRLGLPLGTAKARIRNGLHLLKESFSEPLGYDLI